MKIEKVLVALFAVIFGVYQVYRAVTAVRFENIGEGLNPPEENRYVSATLPMRIAVGTFAIVLIVFGMWMLLKVFGGGIT